MKNNGEQKKNAKPRRFRRLPFFAKTLQRKLTFYILAVLISVSLIILFIYSIIALIFPISTMHPLLTGTIFLVSLTSISAVTSSIIYKSVFRPLRKIIAATEEVAAGNYKVQLDETSHPQSDLGMLQRSFNNMARELDGIEMLRNDFINNFSHEFKTPVVSIRGFAEQLRIGGLTEEERREYIDIIADESKRLTNMASNVLLLSKLESQQIVTEKTEFYLDEQIRAAILMLEGGWVEKNIELDIDLDAVKYTFNEDMLSHVWINLFSNAVKFTPSEGKISCTLRDTGSAAVVVISDTGIGMDEEVQRHIFEKFYQGDRSHSSSGNGIGLTIVHRIIDLCEGSISIESRPEMGSTFTVILPYKS